MNIKDISFQPSKTKKGEYGIKFIGNGISFYKDNIKYLKYDNDFYNKGSFKYSSLLVVDKEHNTSYYEYDKDLYINTLYDSLYFKGKYWNLRYKWFKTFKKNLKSTFQIKTINECQSKKFFSDRIDLLRESLNISNCKDILNDVIKFIEKIDLYSFRTHLSNGDLTDTNICLNNKICDTENYGYNIVICDLAIFFVSILYGRWIYPKYNYQAYVFRKNKIIDCKFRINKKQKFILKQIIKLINPIEFDYFKKLIIMRLVTPISLKQVNNSDKETIDDIIRIVYMSNNYNIVKNIVTYSKQKQ